MAAYALFWVTGIGFLLFRRDDPAVNYHAAQSTVLFGGLSIILLALNFLANALTGSWLAVLLQILIWGGILYWLVAWAYCLYLAWESNGSRFDVPLLGDYVTPYAERLADAIG